MRLPACMSQMDCNDDNQSVGIGGAMETTFICKLPGATAETPSLQDINYQASNLTVLER